jgi:hypothetical protein
MAEDTREWVEARRADLAKCAWQFVQNEQVQRALVALDPSALRTLLGAATDASCLLEVLILLRYQQGRDRAKWPDVLVSGIERELKDAVEAATKARGAAADPDAAEARLATSWLGFLVRLHRSSYEAAREEQRARRG